MNSQLPEGSPLRGRSRSPSARVAYQRFRPNTCSEWAELLRHGARSGYPLGEHRHRNPDYSRCQYGDPPRDAARARRTASLFLRFALTGLAAMVLISAAAFVIVRRSATASALNQDKSLSQLAGHGIVAPLLTRACSAAAPASSSARPGGAGADPRGNPDRARQGVGCERSRRLLRRTHDDRIAGG